MCSEAVASAAEGDRARVVEAFNWGILSMMSMPFILVAVVGGLIYRSLRRDRAAGSGAEGG